MVQSRFVSVMAVNPEDQTSQVAASMLKCLSCQTTALRRLVDCRILAICDLNSSWEVDCNKTNSVESINLEQDKKGRNGV